MGRDLGPAFGGEGSKPEFRFDAVSDGRLLGCDKSSLGVILLATEGHVLGRGQEQHRVRWAGAENGHHFSVTEPFGSSLASSSSVPCLSNLEVLIFSAADSPREHIRNANSWAPAPPGDSRSASQERGWGPALCVPDDSRAVGQKSIFEKTDPVGRC